MKIAVCSAVAVFAVVGIALAQDFNNFNNFGNDDGFFNNDDGFFDNDDNSWALGGRRLVGGGSGASLGFGGMSSWGSGSWGSGSWGSDSWGGQGGYGGGHSGGHVSYIPLPLQAKAKSSGLEALLPVLLLAFLLPYLFSQNQSSGGSVVVNVTARNIDCGYSLEPPSLGY